ncbi:MAG: non-canonical purine NTP pyrophosphatase [Bdellovibrionales bacterium]
MLIFCTSNSGKFTRFCEELAPYGITAEQRPLELTEPQESDIPDVARMKAQQAYKLTGQPCIVEDSGLCIPELNNFPEALTKPVLTRLGLDGFLKLVSGLEDRSCYFISCLAYADIEGNVDVIIDRSMTGELLHQPKGENFTRSWSVLSHVFRPTNFNTSMSDMTDAQLEALFAEWRPQNIFHRFGQHVSANRVRFGLQEAA